jgi:hypothetical protein
VAHDSMGFLLFGYLQQGTLHRFVIDDTFDGVQCALLCRMYAHNRTSAESKGNLLCSSMQNFQRAAVIPANHDRLGR